MTQYVVKDGDGNGILVFADEALANDQLDTLVVSENPVLAASTIQPEIL